MFHVELRFADSHFDQLNPRLTGCRFQSTCRAAAHDAAAGAQVSDFLFLRGSNVIRDQSVPRNNGSSRTSAVGLEAFSMEQPLVQSMLGEVSCSESIKEDTERRWMANLETN